MVAMTRTFVVTAQLGRSGWWVLEAPEVGAVSQVRHLDDAEAEMREAIAYLAGIPESECIIDVRPIVSDGYREHAESAATQRQIAATATRRAAQESRAAAHALRSEGLTLRDIGTIMGVSHQRAAQLLAPMN